MNTTEQSYVRVNFSTKEFEISGSEHFIDKYYKNLEELLNNTTVITSSYDQSHFSNQDATENKSINSVSTDSVQESADKYIKAGIYAIDSESQKVFINKRIPGKNNAEKMKNIALITLFARKSKIVGSEIKEMCKKQGCLDNSNFAATFTRDYETFMKSGNGQKWTIELTLKGEEDAKNLLENMINE